MDDLKETVESVHASITFDNGKKIEAELPKDE